MSQNIDKAEGTGPDSNDRYMVPALWRGLHLLGQFNRDERELSGADLSRRLGLPRASVFRMLYTLEQGGFVERVGDGANYRLGAAVLRLGFEFLASMELTEHGRPILDRLRDVSGYAAHLVIRDGREVVFVGKSPGRIASFHSIQVGARLPAHATVLGRLLLADVDPAGLRRLYPQSPLPAFTAQTPTTHEELFDRIAHDRKQGYGVSEAGYESGISTIAAPVHNAQGDTVAAISITVPNRRVPEAELPRLIDQVKAAAAELSARMSHTPGAGQWQPGSSEKTMV